MNSTILIISVLGTTCFVIIGIQELIKELMVPYKRKLG